jgi:hypothetical protein
MSSPYFNFLIPVLILEKNFVLNSSLPEITSFIAPPFICEAQMHTLYNRQEMREYIHLLRISTLYFEMPNFSLTKFKRNESVCNLYCTVKDMSCCFP